MNPDRSKSRCRDSAASPDAIPRPAANRRSGRTRAGGSPRAPSARRTAAPGACRPRPRNGCSRSGSGARRNRSARPARVASARSFPPVIARRTPGGNHRRVRALCPAALASRPAMPIHRQSRYRPAGIPGDCAASTSSPRIGRWRSGPYPSLRHSTRVCVRGVATGTDIRRPGIRRWRAARRMCWLPVVDCGSTPPTRRADRSAIAGYPALRRGRNGWPLRPHQRNDCSACVLQCMSAMRLCEPERFSGMPVDTRTAASADRLQPNGFRPNRINWTEWRFPMPSRERDGIGRH